MHEKLKNVEARVAVIFGADTRLGQATLSHFEKSLASVICVTTEGISENPTKEVHRLMQVKKPSIVVNCMIDPDSGFLPADPVYSLLGPTQAMLQQCSARGATYIHASSSRIYGQKDVLKSPRDFTPFDLAYSGNDVWSQLLGDAERLVLTHTHSCSPTRWREGNGNFPYFLLRLPHLLHAANQDGRPRPLVSLERAIVKAASGSQTFAVPDIEARVGLMTTSDAAECIYATVDPAYTLVSGSYNVSTPAVKLREISMYLDTAHSITMSLVPEGISRDMSPVITGVSTSTAMSAKRWVSRGMPLPGSWKRSIDYLVKFARPRQATLARLSMS